MNKYRKATNELFNVVDIKQEVNKTMKDKEISIKEIKASNGLDILTYRKNIRS